MTKSDFRSESADVFRLTLSKPCVELVDRADHKFGWLTLPISSKIENYIYFTFEYVKRRSSEWESLRINQHGMIQNSTWRSHIDERLSAR